MTPFTPRVPLFALIGACGFVIDAGVMVWVHGWVGWDPVMARGVSFPVAVTVTWLLNRRWVFDKAAGSGTASEYSGYVLVQVLGAATNLAVFVSLVWRVPTMETTPVLALAIGATVSLGLNYALLRRWVYVEAAPTPVDGNGYAGVANLEAMEGAERYNAFLLRTIVACVPDPTLRIVDFGAGTGTFAVPLAASGLPVLAVEPDPALREHIAVRGPLTGASLSVLSDSSVDYLYSLNVLEHIGEDQAALRECARVLRDDGSLLIYVPAFMLLFGPMDRLVGHQRRYRLQTLRQMVEDAGFAVTRAEYVDSLGFLAALLLRFFGSASGGLNPVVVRVYDRWCFPLSRRLDRLTRRVFGKNLLLQARRLPRPAELTHE